MIVLAGFMHILSKEFIDSSAKIINLHPALPGSFVGINCIERAYEAFQRGEITKTGVMVHYCVPEVDRGAVICFQECLINSNETLKDLERKIHEIEHFLIVEGTLKALGL